MKSRDLQRAGVPKGKPIGLAIEASVSAIRGGTSRADVLQKIREIVEAPGDFSGDAVFGRLADSLVAHFAAHARFEERSEPAPYQQWGEDLDTTSIQQMQNACALPISVRGALMADAHVGYGLPIGGVLATRNSVIPYAVGVDIACRVSMSVYDVPVSKLDEARGSDELARAIEDETRFGIGASFQKRRDHAVMDEDWSVTDVTQHVRDKAWKQLGSSGSGNHFVEFGTIDMVDPRSGLEPGAYLALLTHSGSRGAGASVAKHYSDLAMREHPELPAALRHLAWLDLDSEAGQEYWSAMSLMGLYASANHEVIHRHLTKRIGGDVLLHVENHHNFAWKEVHDGEELIVHRKGATPAGDGDLGVIPGSMATSTYLVRGRGSAASLDSASHGAGRVMSRKKAKASFTWKDAKGQLDRAGVRLLSAGIDENPKVYKDIEAVMDAQSDLVEILARFSPRIVKMAPAGEPAED